MEKREEAVVENNEEEEAKEGSGPPPNGVEKREVEPTEEEENRVGVVPVENKLPVFALPNIEFDVAKSDPGLESVPNKPPPVCEPSTPPPVPRARPPVPVNKLGPVAGRAVFLIKDVEHNRPGNDEPREALLDCPNRVEEEEAPNNPVCPNAGVLPNSVDPVANDAPEDAAPNIPVFCVWLPKRPPLPPNSDPLLLFCPRRAPAELCPKILPPAVG